MINSKHILRFIDDTLFKNEAIPKHLKIQSGDALKKYGPAWTNEEPWRAWPQKKKYNYKGKREPHYDSVFATNQKMEEELKMTALIDCDKFRGRVEGHQTID